MCMIFNMLVIIVWHFNYKIWYLWQNIQHIIKNSCHSNLNQKFKISIRTRSKYVFISYTKKSLINKFLCCSIVNTQPQRTDRSVSQEPEGRVGVHGKQSPRQLVDASTEYGRCPLSYFKAPSLSPLTVIIGLMVTKLRRL